MEYSMGNSTEYKTGASILQDRPIRCSTGCSLTGSGGRTFAKTTYWYDVGSAYLQQSRLRLRTSSWQQSSWSGQRQIWIWLSQRISRWQLDPAYRHPAGTDHTQTLVTQLVLTTLRLSSPSWYWPHSDSHHPAGTDHTQTLITQLVLTTLLAAVQSRTLDQRMGVRQTDRDISRHVPYVTTREHTSMCMAAWRSGNVVHQRR